jgi:hypothetical protein
MDYDGRYLSIEARDKARELREVIEVLQEMIPNKGMKTWVDVLMEIVRVNV